MNLTIDQALKDGVTAINEGKFGRAEGLYHAILRLNPKNSDAHNNLGICLQKLNKLDEAVASYKQAILLKPNFSMAYNNLGVTLKILGKLEEARDIYKKAIEMKPDFALALNNLGDIYERLEKPEEAENNYRKALEQKPNFAEVHYNLGNMLTKLSRLDEAKLSYDKALELKPNYKIALLNRGQILFEKGKYELSLKDFDNCNTKDSRSRSLTSLYALDRIDDIYARIKNQLELDNENIRVAAFSSFIFFKKKRDTEHNFCKKPIDFINISNISNYIQNSNLFVSGLIKELKNIKTKWEPLGKTTIKGFQSRSNLLVNPTKNLKNLKSIIINEIKSYQLRFQNENCSFIKKWPKVEKLACWHVILKQQGHQNSHIHPGGWLSGVFYLKVTPDLGKDEGAIEFCLNGEHYTDVNSPKLIHQPKVGDIVLFPSSLHHRTIPFKTNTDRISIAFDLIP
tara:strand:+ start:172 stop:1536 length:1365 start_codon:yes stop_codon:yes gene_type:complete